MHTYKMIMFLLLCSLIKLSYSVIHLYSAIFLSRYGLFFYNFVVLQFLKKNHGFLPSSVNLILSCNALLDVSCVLVYIWFTSLARVASLYHARKVLGEFGVGSKVVVFT